MNSWAVSFSVWLDAGIQSALSACRTSATCLCRKDQFFVSSRPHTLRCASINIGIRRLLVPDVHILNVIVHCLLMLSEVCWVMRNMNAGNVSFFRFCKTGCSFLSAMWVGFCLEKSWCYGRCGVLPTLSNASGMEIDHALCAHCFYSFCVECRESWHTVLT